MMTARMFGAETGHQRKCISYVLLLFMQTNAWPIGADSNKG